MERGLKYSPMEINMKVGIKKANLMVKGDTLGKTKSFMRVSLKKGIVLGKAR